MEHLPDRDRGKSIASVEVRALEASPGRSLTLLAEGAAMNVLELDAGMYAEFRASVSKLALQAPDQLPDEEKLDLVRALVREFESYRNGSDAVLRERIFRWRAIARKMLRELAQGICSDGRLASAARLVEQLGSLTTAAELKNFERDLESFLHPVNIHSPAGGGGLPLIAADLSTANDNAAGLPGGGSAIQDLKAIQEHGGSGFVVVFQLGCLDMIVRRFGDAAAQDCLMATAAYLIGCLDSQDKIYHWTDSALLAILQGRSSARVVTGELQRIAAQNRNLTIRIGERNVMVRIPLDFQIAPIDRLDDAEVLPLISGGGAANPQEISR
jgi:GGDEF domain-containing protein